MRIECPTDGALIRPDDQLRDGHYECRACRGVFHPVEVVADV